MQGLIVFIVICTILILLLITFITVILYRYQQKQILYFKNIEELKITYEKDRLHSILEIQEQTFQNISREIHDNIGQKLSLAKLHLNTISSLDSFKAKHLVNDAVNLISECVKDLSDISRSLSSDIVLNYGLIKALEFEKAQLEKSELFTIELAITGDSVFMDADRELVLFRIAQEALNNIMKHASATFIFIGLHYDPNLLTFKINDNGRGFLTDETKISQGAGLINMAKRANMLKGNCSVNSIPDNGTCIKIEIPLYKYHADS